MLLFRVSISGQVVNYILNPSFEEVSLTSTLTSSGGMIGWSSLDSATGGAFSSFSLGPPFSNAPGSSFGFQFPRSGKNYIGSCFYYNNPLNNINLRWYPWGRLKKELNPEVVYCGRYFVVPTEMTTIGIDSYGMYFGGIDLDTINHCQVPLTYLSPQISRQGPPLTDTTNWTAISGTFIAGGGEKYVLLGNFNSDVNTQTVIANPSQLPNLFNDNFIDDVSLVEMELPAYAGNDTSIWFGDSVFIGREPDVGLDYACQWYLLPNDTVPIDTIAGLWVKPNAPATYVVRQQLWCSGVKWDTVTVGFDIVGLREDPFRNFKVYPSITTGKVNVCGLAEPGYAIDVCDITGKVVGRYVSSEKPCTELSLSLTNGMYFVTVSKSNFGRTQKIIVSQ